MASGAGDGGGPVIATVPVDGRSVLPLAPVHLRAAAQPSGDLVFTWARRGRAGWRWIDGADVPLVEERELYEVTVTPSSGPSRTIETGEPRWTLAAADRPGAAFRVAIVQCGTCGRSPAASITIA